MNADSDDDEKAELVKHLRRLNMAYLRNGAVPDLTVKEAKGFVSVAALRVAVEASEHRLAAIIAGVL